VTRRSAKLAVLVVAALGAAPLAGAGSAFAGVHPSTTNCATSTPSREGKFAGIVAPGTVRGGMATCLAARSPRAATPPQGAYNNTPPLVYNGGAVMDTTSSVTLTPIYWAPSGYSFTSSYQTLTERFITDVAHDSGSNANVFAALHQYTDGSSNKITGTFTAGTPISDTTAYPSSGGCTADAGKTYSDATGYSACLTDAQIETEISSVLSAHGLPSDLSHIYLIFLPKAVESCFTTQDNTSGGQCSLSQQGGAFCGYHSFLGSGAVYADMPYPISDNPVTGGTCSSDGGRIQGGFGVGNQSPNANLDADTVISVTSHELSEAVTDPYLNAWYDSSGNEIGDECAYIYGDTSSWGGSSGQFSDQTINGHHYFIQEEFSNAEYAANPSYSCIQSALPVTVRFTSIAPGAASVGGHYTVTASATYAIPVTLSVDASSTGICSLSGTASGSSVTFNAVGACRIDASQPGDSAHASTPPVQQAFIVRYSSRTTLSAPLKTLRYGHENAERLTFVVAPQTSLPAPTGKVAIVFGSTTMCTASLVGGRGSCVVPARFLRVGAHLGQARYAGSSKFTPSSSTQVRIVVTR